MRDLSVDYARDLRVVGICVSSVFPCCRFLRAGGFCLLLFGLVQYNDKTIQNYPFHEIFVTSQNIYLFFTITTILSINSIIVCFLFVRHSLRSQIHKEAPHTQMTLPS